MKKLLIIWILIVSIIFISGCTNEEKTGFGTKIFSEINPEFTNLNMNYMYTYGNAPYDPFYNDPAKKAIDEHFKRTTRSNPSYPQDKFEYEHPLHILISEETREKINNYVFKYKLKKLEPPIKNYNGNIGSVIEEKIKGHCLVWDMTKNRMNDMHNLLPHSMQAEFWDSEITVFLIPEDISDPTIQTNIYMLNLPEKNIIGAINISVMDDWIISGTF